MVKADGEWLSVREFHARYRGKIGITNIYARLKDGSLPSVRVGRRILIPSDALARLLSLKTSGDSGTTA